MFFRKLLLASSITASYAALAAENSTESSPIMETMVITASLTEKTTQTAPAFTTVISAEDLSYAPVNGFAELLKESVGVNNFTDPSGRDQVQLRGLAGNYTLVLVNGKRVSSSSALWRGGDFDLSSVPLNSIQQIEVVRGPMSSLYGADAMGGVVNIITKAPLEDWQGLVSGEYRAVNTGDGGNQLRAGVSAQGGLSDNLFLSISAESYDRDAWFSEGDVEGESAPKFEEKQAQNLYSSLSWQLAENQNLDFDLGVNKDERPLDIYYAAGAFIDTRDQDISRTTLGVSYRGEWDWGSAHAQLSHEDATLNDFNSHYDAPQDRELTEENLYFKAYSTFQVGDANVFTLGLDNRVQTVGDVVSYQDTGEVSITDRALFGQDEINFGAVTLTLGGRVDDNEFFGNHFTPRAYLVWEVNDNFTLKGGVSEAFKAPQAYQLSEEYSIISCGGSCFLTGNPELEPEESSNYEIGFALNQASWNLSAVYFKNDVDNMISALYDAEANQRYWANIDKVKTSGFEVEGSISLSENISLGGNFTSLDTENTTGEKLENRPEQMFNLRLDWDVLDSLHARLTFNRIGKQTVFVWPDYTSLPAYNRFDLGFSSAVRDMTFTYGIRNLTDVQTQEEDANFNTYELGRNVYFGVAYKF